MKIVLDSNVLLIAVGRRSKYKTVWDEFISGNYQLVISDDIAYEYQEILQQHSAPGVAELVSEILIESPDVINQQIYYNWNAIIKDPDDNKFFDVAIAANVDYLVTNDAHFDTVKNLDFPFVKVISATEFLDILQGT